MTFLPIVQRELRLAARRRNTRRIRWWTAVVAHARGRHGLLVLGLAGGPARAGSGFLFTGADGLRVSPLHADRRAAHLGLPEPGEARGHAGVAVPDGPARL